MPRGRHRHSPPLHRLLTPTTIAGVSLTSAAVAWLLAEPVALRLLVAATAAAGVTGAVVMRGWDRAAGRRVAELTRERVRDEWRAEDRIAELESDLEESRALRAKLEKTLRAKRVELAGLRGEHAALLRRYATAETERASALEGRRLLAKAAAPTSPAKELPAPSEDRTTAGAPTALGYARAHAALTALARKAGAPAAPGAVQAGGAAAPAEAHARALPQGPAPAAALPPAAPATLPARRTPSAVAPYAAARRTVSRAEGGFDFFGTKSAARTRAAIEAVQNEDLADVVGAEALAVHKAESAEPEFKPRAPEHRAVGQVIDLTAHDETEAIDVASLRTAIS
ncbi:hypothetical protein [Streptomyces sp. NRRL S-87]|uniref:hypothetical protein n=1 Tax=Streptomyces sp. NRRL S-87 TaxID=1463920 RepID=UPI0004C25C0E|nr:hypothetical protein [Streptomyces sp. NRRL S-87]